MSVGQWHGGKGSASRVSNKAKFDAEFDRIFKNGKDNDKDSGQATARSDDTASEIRQNKAVRD